MNKLQKEVINPISSESKIEINDEKQNDVVIPKFNYTVTAFDGDKEINIDELVSNNSFKSMNVLSEKILDSLIAFNMIKPTQTQKIAIPICLNQNGKYKNNVMVQAPQQNGKTLALSLIILERIDTTNTHLQALYVVGCREIAIQTKNLLSSIGQYIDNLNILLAIKGNKCISKTQWNKQICVGTPNIIIDTVLNPLNIYINAHLGTTKLNSFLHSFKIIAFDGLDQFVSNKQFINTSNIRRGGRRKRENHNKTDLNQLHYIWQTIKDNMYKWEKGNIQWEKNPNYINQDNISDSHVIDSWMSKDVEISYEMEDNWNCKKHKDENPMNVTWNLKKVPIDFQTLGFSTTYSLKVKQIIKHIFASNSFISIHVGNQQSSLQLDNIKLLKIHCKDNVDKMKTLERVLSLSNIGKTIIFVNTIQTAKQLMEALKSKDIGIYENDDSNDQNKVLIVLNMIERGIDVPSVEFIINFEIPNKMKDNNKVFDGETFMERVKRTGRFGRNGICIQLLSEKDTVSMRHLDHIQKDCSLNIEQVENTNKSINQYIVNWIDTV